MLKKGFTLAEVLITLGIIGVVATLTTPALINNVGNSRIGPSLAKFVNTFEVAMETAMSEEGVSRVSNLGTETFATTGLETLSRYMIMAPTGNVAVAAADGSAAIGAQAGCWMLKDGTIIIPYAVSSNGIGGNSYGRMGSYLGVDCAILVDIGGARGSHRAGKEVFAFIVDQNGSLIPVGSRTHRWLDPNYDVNCSVTSNDVAANLACTGQIADNKWKADF